MKQTPQAYRLNISIAIPLQVLDSLPETYTYIHIFNISQLQLCTYLMNRAKQGKLIT